MLFGFPKLPCFNDENHDILAVQFDQRAYLVFRDAIHACKVADFIGFIAEARFGLRKTCSALSSAIELTGTSPSMFSSWQPLPPAPEPR